MEIEADIIRKYEEYAKKKGFKLNPNNEMVEAIITGLLHNEEKYGKRYCPCRRVTEDPKEDKKIICPCVYHEKEIEEQGHCHCQLFFKK